KKVVKNEVEKADGVAAANITGGLIPEILVEINQDRLMSKNIALNEVVEAISKANLNYPAGTIEESFYEYLIRTIGEFGLVKEMDGVVVGIDDRQKKSEFSDFNSEDKKAKEEEAMADKRLIILKEIAKVSDTFKDKTSVSRFNRRENVSLSIQKQADANTLRVATNVRDVLERIKGMIPKDVRIDTVYDQSEFIKTAINGVRDASVQGGILAFLVLLFFLKNVKSAAIVALNIPISIMAVFSLMHMSGITINMISLGGLALGVGMLVDNGIVVIENIYRHRQEEKRPIKEASVYGATEVSGAILGSTLTTIAVFLPMVFVIGIAGQLFKELAFTVTFSLLGSLAVALTLIPILSSRVQSIPEVSTDEDSGNMSGFLGFFQSIVQKVLLFFINHKVMCLALVTALFLGTCLLIPLLDTEFLPKIDQGQFMIKLELPPGTRLEVTDSVAEKIETYLFAMPEVSNVTTNIGSTKEKKGTALLETKGPHQGQIIVNLNPVGRWGSGGAGFRILPTSVVLNKLKNLIRPEDLSNAHVEYVLQDSVFQSAFQTSAPIVIEIKGQDLSKLREITSDVESRLKSIPGLYSIRDTFIDPAPEVKISVFKDKAATYNLSVSDIAVSAQTAVKGFLASKFKREGEEIDIRVRLREEDRNNMAKVRRLELHSKLGINVPLAEVAYFTIGKGPSEIKRLDQERIVVVTANIFKQSFNVMANAVTAMLGKIEIPLGYSAQLTGEREQIEESFRSLRMALILSIILVFMIMASQFESLWQPFVILFTIPLSVIGVIAILLLTNTPLSVMVILGVIILGGIVVNNGIVLIDYTNILRRGGMSSQEAVVVASRRRLRPIVMTALTTILGLVPLALALNEGAELQQPMAIAVIGGLAVSTFLSLIVIPTIYLGLENMLTYIQANVFRFKKREPSESVEDEVLLEETVLEEPEEAEPEKTDAENDATGKIEYVVEPPVKPAEVKSEPQPEQQKPLSDQPLKDNLRKEVEGWRLTTEPDITDEEDKEDIIDTAEDIAEESPRKEEKIQKPDKKKKITPDILKTLSLRHLKLVRYLRSKKRITRTRYANKFKISVPTAARDLKQLVEMDILVAKGPSAVGRYYELNEALI
ncbi:efflux RND transporter permease subunit, partial [Candidatus Omnitrophota bacterium]